MDVMLGYKQTEAGVIPEDWAVISMAELFTFQNGVNADKAAYGKGIPFINVLEVITHSTLTEARIPGRILLPPQTSSAFRVQTGDVLFNRTSETQEEVGLASVYVDNKEVVFGGFVIRARPRNGSLNTLFSSYALRSPAIRRQIVSRGQGAVRANIGQQELSKVQVFVPPLPEQEAIAEALSDADALIESLEQLIAKKRHIKQGAMQELLAGKKRLPGFRGEWEVKRIAEVASLSSEKNTTAAHLPVLTCSKYHGFVDSLGYFKNQVFSNDTSAYKLIKRGQIGYPSNHVEEGSIGLQDLYEVALVSPIYVVFSVSEEVDGYFLHRVLKLDSYRQKFKTATTSSVDRRGSLRWPAFSEITVSIPTLPEQTAIATILSDMETEIAALEAKLVKARQIKQGMMHNLLTGKIRLAPQASTVIPFPKAKEFKVESIKRHNRQFKEAVLISVLAKRFGTEQYPLGRKRYTKLSYLFHRHVEGQPEGYLKKAAGPYNPDTRYKGPERIAQENGYIRFHKRDQFTGFIAGEAIGKAEYYFSKWYGNEVLAWLEQFRFKSKDELELLATVDMAIEDLRRAGQTVDVEAVKRIIQAHPEWEAKLQRDIFSDDNIARALQICREVFA